jgi:putative membrane protein
MKTLLRHIFINYLVIFLADLVYPGFTVLQNFKTLLTAAVIWLLLNKIVKPIIKLLFLPINLITLNLFSWLIGLVTLFLLQVFADGVKIESYSFPGISSGGFSLPPFFFNIFFSYLITSILLNSLHTAVVWLFRKDGE